MLESYNALRKVDISSYISQRDGADYLPWAKVVDLLHEHGAEKVYFTPITNANGHSLFCSDNEYKDKHGNTHRCYEVKIKITIDDDEWIEQYPLMNGINPVKDNSINQLRISNAQKRAFVKGVAVRTGLGFDLWLKDEGVENSLDAHDIFKIKQRVQETFTAKYQKLGTPKAVYKALGYSEKEVKNIFEQFQIIFAFENKLKKVQ